MSSRFLLPCQCGNNVAIHTSQAGQTVTCQCGRSLTAPSMRGIRQLAQADEPSASAPRATRTWSSTKGLLFACGSLFLLFGLAMGVFNYLRYSHAVVVRPSEEGLQQSMEMIEQSSAEELWDMWHMVEHHGLGEHDDSPFVTARKYADYFSKLMITGGALIGLGLILCLAALILPSRSADRQPTAR